MLPPNNWTILGVLLLLILFAEAIARRIPFFDALVVNGKKDAITSLDSLRGLLALGVFFSHSAVSKAFWSTGEWSPSPSHFFSQLATLSVLLFFYLSGFLFWSKLISHGENAPGTPFEWARFFEGRVRRMVPAYYVSLLVIFMWVGIQSGFDLHEKTGAVVLAVFRWLSFALPDGDYPRINADPHTLIYNAAVAWTLRYEWLFLLSLPFLTWFSVRHRVFLLLGLTAGIYLLLRRGLFATSIAAGLTPWYQHTSLGFLTYLATGFGMGMLAAYLRFYYSSGLQFLTRARGAFLILTCGTYLLIYQPEIPPVFQLPLQRLLLFFIFLPLALGNDLFGVLRWRGLRLLGLVSYSTYLFHGILLYFFSALVSNYIDVSAMGSAAYAVFTAVTGMGVVALSAIIFRYVEHPAMHWKGKARKTALRAQQVHSEA